MDVTTIIKLGLTLSMFLLVFCIGMKIDVNDVTYLWKNPKQLLRSILAMSIVMPIIAAVIGKTMDLTPEVKLALIATSVAPIPPLLPRKLIKSGGMEDYAYSLLITAVLLSIIIVPVSILLIGNFFDQSVIIPAKAIAPVVLKSVLIPIGIGMIVRNINTKFANGFERPLSKIASILLLLSILPVFVVAWPTIMQLIQSSALIAIILFCILAVIVGHSFGGPDDEHKTVLAMGTLSRHPGVALAIATIGFPDSQKPVLAVILLILLVAAVTSSLYLAWQRRQHQHIVRRPKLSGHPAI